MDNNIVIRKCVDNLRYKKYTLTGDIVSGYIVLEQYGDIWNLELMEVSPTGKGFGSLFLNYVLKEENLQPQNMTVCPISYESRRFFQRHGFKHGFN